MAPTQPVFTRETFDFFRALGRNNRTAWMEQNRERYRSAIVAPFRRLLEALTPAALALNENFDVSGRTGANFSRINRDIRFAKDKTPYKTQMYLKFEVPSAGDREGGQLYAALSTDTATSGFRLYAGAKRRESTLALLAEPRVLANPKWVARQKKRLGRSYDSYWYTMEKGEWTKHEGWPTEPENWKRILGWIVRRKFSPAAATRATFPKDVAKVFRDLYPLVKFTSLPDSD